MNVRPSLLVTLVVYLLAPLALNGLIFALHWDTPSSPNPMLPPGYVVGVIWVGLFAAMGLARWNAAKRVGPACFWIDAVAILCLLYPFYTAGLRSDVIGFWGIVVTLTFALLTMFQVSRTSKRSAGLLVLLVLWLGYAGVALGRELTRFV